MFKKVLTEKIMHDYLTTIPRFTAETGWEHGRISINRRHGGFHGISWATDYIVGGVMHITALPRHNINVRWCP